MKNLSNDLYKKIEEINRNVKEKLKRRGVIVPIKLDDGSVDIGRYRIERNQNSTYSILSPRGEKIVSGINLPHTAALIANNMALGKWLDNDLLQIDIKYGHALFDETIHRKSAEANLQRKNYDKAEIMLIKSDIAKHKKESYKRSIIFNFEKLLAFR